MRANVFLLFTFAAIIIKLVTGIEEARVVADGLAVSGRIHRSRSLRYHGHRRNLKKKRSSSKSSSWEERQQKPRSKPSKSSSKSTKSSSKRIKPKTSKSSKSTKSSKSSKSSKIVKSRSESGNNSGEDSVPESEGNNEVEVVRLIDYMIYLATGRNSKPKLQDLAQLVTVTEEFLSSILQREFDGTSTRFLDLELKLKNEVFLPNAVDGFNYQLEFDVVAEFDASSDSVVPSFEETNEILSIENTEDYLQEIQEIDAFADTESIDVVPPSASPRTPAPSTPSTRTPAPVAPANPTPPVSTLFPTVDPVLSPVSGTQSPTSVVAPFLGPTLFPTPAPTASPTATASVPPTGSLFPSVSPSEPLTGTPTVEGFDITLDLSNVPSGFRDAFVEAGARWEQVVVGDVPERTSIPTGSSCGVALPDSIDDLFICATVEPNDGVGGVLGFAGPEFARENTVIPFIGTMTFDSADIDSLQTDGTLKGVILHEMGHVLGLGTLWEIQQLQTGSEAPCPYTANSFASSEFRKISGCTGAVPIEQTGGQGTACGHWDESCLVDELMTGFSTGALPLSSITIGSLEDLGYEVNYDAADAFTASDLDVNCICNALQEKDEETKTEAEAGAEPVEQQQGQQGQQEEQQEKGTIAKPPTDTIKLPGHIIISTQVEDVKKTIPLNKKRRRIPPFSASRIRNATVSKDTNIMHRGGRRRRRRLSDEGRKAAMAFGYAKLAERRALKLTMKPIDRSTYVADQIIIVIYQEGEEVYSVEVRGTNTTQL